MLRVIIYLFNIINIMNLNFTSMTMTISHMLAVPSILFHCNSQRLVFIKSILLLVYSIFPLTKYYSDFDSASSYNYNISI